MLLERGLAKEALAAFEATLTKEPHRSAPRFGAAKRRRSSAIRPRRAPTMPPPSRSPRTPIRSAPDIAAARAFVAKNQLD
jgi:hypothetical protein